MPTSEIPQLNTVSLSEIDALANLEGNSFLTLMMPTHESGSETRQDPIRYKNLLREVIEWVATGKLEEDVLSHLRALDRDEFWRHQRAGLALISDGEKTYLLQTPEPLSELALLSDTPYLAPLIPQFGSPGNVAVLLLSWENADLRLLTTDRELQQLGDFPHSMNDLVTPSDPEEQLQYSSHKAKGKGAGDTVMFHGQGEGEQQIEAERLQFFSRLADLVEEQLYQSSLPLMLVGTEEVIGHFNAVSKLDSEINLHASPDALSESDLRKRICEHLDSWNAANLEDAEKQYATASSEQRVASDDVELVAMAMRGQVDKLYFDGKAQLQGDVDPEKLTATADGDKDLINLAVVHTLRNSGQCFRFDGTQLPGGAKKIVAILRYR